jgi:hypothetical protein
VIGFEDWEDPTWLLNTGIDTPLILAEEENRPLWKVIRDQFGQLSNPLHFVAPKVTQGNR